MENKGDKRMTRALLAWLCWCSSFLFLVGLVSSFAVRFFTNEFQSAIIGILHPDSGPGQDRLAAWLTVAQVFGFWLATTILPALVAIGVYEGCSGTPLRYFVGWVCLGLAIWACYPLVDLACELAYFGEPFQLVRPPGFRFVVFTVAALVAFPLGMVGYRGMIYGRRRWLSAFVVLGVFVILVAGERFAANYLKNAARNGTPNDISDPELEDGKRW